MSRLLLSLVAALSLSPLAFADSAALQQFRAGNIQAFSDYVGAPSILVSDYKREIVRPEGAVGLWKWLVVHHARVVASCVDSIPFGKAVVYTTLHEEAPIVDPAKGQLIYIVAPSPKQERYRTGEIELYENFNRVPLEGGWNSYEIGKKKVEAVKG